MTKLQDLPWKKICVEAVTIVGSILLAFAIDAWWQERQIRVEEQEILAGLRTEFVANQKILARNSTGNKGVLQSLEGFLTRIEDIQSKDTKGIALALSVSLGEWLLVIQRGHSTTHGSLTAMQ